MSAAASTVPQVLRAVCKTPLSYFEEFLSTQNFTQLKCMGLVIDRTIGSSRVWAEIDISEFTELCRVSPEWCRQALDDLKGRGVIKARCINPRLQRFEFSMSANLVAEVALASRGFEKGFQGKCEKCDSVDIFRTEFVPLPHTFFRKLPAGVDHATFACVAVICRHSHQWNGKDGIYAEWVELDKSDIERLAGLDARQITNGLSKALELGLIERQDRSGRPSLFKSCPENFGNVGKRDKKTVSQPESKGEREEKPTAAKKEENPVKPQETHEKESGAHRYGLCRACGHFGPVIEAVAVVVDVPRPDSNENRPPSASRVLKKPIVNDRNQAAWDVLEQWHGPQKTILKA